MINNDWDIILEKAFSNQQFLKFLKIVDLQYTKFTIYPAKEDIFNALKLTAYKDVKVVILGQDPYHGGNEAHGLSFSVNKGTKLPPTLRNIYKELYNDLKIDRGNNGSLNDWASQGVLLLNTILTVVKDKPGSHKNLGWEEFTNYIIKCLNEREEPIVFIFWGNLAKEKIKYITNKKHLILTSTHPSPFSAYKGFLGSRHFSLTNKFLKENNIVPIKW